METALSQIIPDFVVEATGGELILSMNNRGIPDMRINREYAEMFQDYAGNKANQTAQMKEAVQFVKQKLDSAQWFIDGEDKRKPLTDEELASILKEKGYIIARRTVAKYREQLGIPVARLRKEI